MSNSLTKVEPLVFIDTEDEAPVAKPQLKRQITFLKEMCRHLWQEDNSSLIKQPMIDDTLVDKGCTTSPKSLLLLTA